MKEGKILVVLLLALATLPCLAKRKTAQGVPAVSAKEISDADARRLSYYFLEGTKQKLSGNYTAAYDLFRHCLDIDPTSAEALFQMAFMQYYLSRDSLAREMFREAAELDPTNPWYAETLAAAYLDAGNRGEGVPALERLARMQPKRTDVLYQLEMEYREMGDVKKCISALDRIELLDGRSLQTTMEKYNLYQGMKKHKEAFAELTSLMEESPHDMRIPILLGREYLEAGEEEKALECYEKVRRSDPDNQDLQIAMMEYLRHKGEDSLFAARRDSLLFAQGVSTDLRMTLLSQVVEELKAKPDSKRTTLQLLDSLSRMYPTPEVYSLRAAYIVYAKASQDSIAMALRDILALDPSNQLAINRLLPYYMAHGQLEDALEMCRMGINSYPDDLTYHYFHGAVLYQLERLDDAIEAFKNGLMQVTDESPDEMVSDLYYVLGDCYHERGDTVEAFRAYDTSLEYNENNSSCLNNYSYYLTLRGERLDKAEEMAYRAIKLEPLNRTFLDTYAWVLFRSGNLSMAKFYISRVIQPSATDETILADEELHPEMIQHAADIYAANGLTEEAARYQRLAEEKTE